MSTTDEHMALLCCAVFRSAFTRVRWLDTNACVARQRCR